MSGPFGIPIFLLTDSYKLSHPDLFPEAKKMTAYGEFRQPYPQDSALSRDDRIVFFGMRYIIENYLSRKWTISDVEKSKLFFTTHNAQFTKFPFPEELFKKFVEENDGMFPVRIRALEEGSVVYPHTPVYVIEAEEPYAKLVTYLETLLTMVWYPSTVATLSRKCRSIIKAAFETSVDSDSYFLLDSRLHDFGFRACTSVEQSIIGGLAHLLNFEGSDTLSAAFYGQFNWNEGKPVATSIPATEHSVMTSHNNEKEAMLKLISMYGEGIFACVMDSYDYKSALEDLLPQIASYKLEKGGFMVLRPDSGDPVETVLMALKASEKVFGATINKKGYKVLNGCGVIQGDGIKIDTLRNILKAVLEAGYSAQNVAFGMGGGLLQKLNRDTMSFATKLSYIQHEDNSERFVFKKPKTDPSKVSLPGQFMVLRDLNTQLPIVYPKPKNENDYKNFKNFDLLKVVYDMGNPIDYKYPTFSEIKNKLEQEWERSSLEHDPLSKELKDLIISLKKD